MTAWNGNTSTYDAFGMITKIVASGTESVHLYTADDERVWTYQTGATSRWTIRDLDGKVLREFQNAAGTWSVQRDYVYRDGQLLAAKTPTTTEHFSLDHLGTPRLITKTDGSYVSFHAYYPFGAEATAFNQDSERMKFTGHERDLGNLGSAADDVDYMHARFYQGQLGRFLRTDPGRQSANSRAPQTWNRYTYSFNNPLNLVDPDGRSPQKFVEYKQYVIEMFTHDRGHGGEHWHLYDKGGKRLLARIAADDGKVVTGSAPKSVLKFMRRSGLIKGGGKLLGVAGLVLFADSLNAAEFSAAETEARREAEKAIQEQIAGGFIVDPVLTLFLEPPTPDEEDSEDDQRPKGRRSDEKKRPPEEDLCERMTCPDHPSQLRPR